VHLWSAAVKEPIAWFLNFLYVNLQTVPLAETIGAYGVAIIILTIIIRALLSPLTYFQLTTQRKTMAEQRKLAPQVAELRKKFKKEPQKLNTEMMKLYQEHGVNPLGGLVGCAPLVVQIPILTALYYVFQGFAKSAHSAAPFIFVPNLNDSAAQHAIFVMHLVGFTLPVPILGYAIFPLLAAITTFIQSKMLQQPPPPNPTEQELQTQSMQRTMVWLSPVMIGVFALQVPAGLGLYWFVGNVVSIILQYFVVGWGSLLPRRDGGGPVLAVAPKGGGGPKNGSKPGLKPSPQPGAGSRRRRK
jgi:YidC/Oxa1 family membrane protein insertase